MKSAPARSTLGLHRFVAALDAMATHHGETSVSWAKSQAA